MLFSSRAPIGYVAIASQPLTTNQGFKSFVLPQGIDSSYVYYYLLGSRELVEQLAGGTTFKEISGASAARTPFALAPLPEQRRIVAEIEKQLTRLDASVAALERVRANLKRYRASVLKTACEGRLVPTEAELVRAQNRGYEPADRLLQRILAERRARWQSQPRRRGKYKDPVPPDTSTLPELPEGWMWATVDSSRRASNTEPRLRLILIRPAYPCCAWATSKTVVWIFPISSIFPPKILRCKRPCLPTETYCLTGLTVLNSWGKVPSSRAACLLPVLRLTL